MQNRHYHNPSNLPRSPAFSQGVSVSASARTIYVSGQNAVTADGSLVGKDDLATQTTKSLENLKEVLADAGATIYDVVKWNVYVLNGLPAEEGFRAFLAVWGNAPNPPALTVTFVAGFAVPDVLVEIDAVAAVDSERHQDNER